MTRFGILTYHYSNNFGGVLQSYALYNYLKSRSLNVEIIDFVPSSYKVHSLAHNIIHTLGFRKNPFEVNREDLVPHVILQRLKAKKEFNKRIVHKFDLFRDRMELSLRVDERKVSETVQQYDTLIAGSDQVWGLGERGRPFYFLGFEEFRGNKVSYAADSTVADVGLQHMDKLKKELKDFDSISVRNEHTQRFVRAIIGKKPPIVADPTLLWDFHELNQMFPGKSEPYILVYILGKDIPGSNKKAIDEIKRVYGDLKVYAIVIPTMRFNVCDYADEVFYDLDPEEWLGMIRHSTFVYTDSFHGTLFALKFHKPFLAYYAEERRASRFIDLKKRYGLDKYIVSTVDEIDKEGSLHQLPPFDVIDETIEKECVFSIRFLEESLSI